MFTLYGYGEPIWDGALLTVKLSLAGFVAAFLMGLLGAGAKLSRARLLNLIADGYTTLVRGVPDLVLMLLLFYGLQIAVNMVTDSLKYEQIQIDPFAAGVVAVGAIYGAYFTETFRGAHNAVAPGTIEAAHAAGMPDCLTFRRIVFPQMMRYALPGIANIWQVVLKATALVSLIGLTDVIRITQDAGRSTVHPMFFALASGAFYLVISTVSGFGFAWLRRRLSAGFARPRS